MVEIFIGMIEAIGGYLRDFKGLSTGQKIGFFFILTGILSILVVVLILSLKFPANA